MKVIVCRKCGDEFESASARRCHTTRFHQAWTTLSVANQSVQVAKTNGRWPCPLCPKTYSLAGHLQAHCITQHTRPSPPPLPKLDRADLYCATCDFALLTPFAKIAHDYIDHDIPPPENYTLSDEAPIEPVSRLPTATDQPSRVSP